jgi:hypothetical protein
MQLAYKHKRVLHEAYAKVEKFAYLYVISISSRAKMLLTRLRLQRKCLQLGFTVVPST